MSLATAQANYDHATPEECLPTPAQELADWINSDEKETLAELFRRTSVDFSVVADGEDESWNGEPNCACEVSFAIDGGEDRAEFRRNLIAEMQGIVQKLKAGELI